MSEEVDCFSDALLADVVAEGQEARRDIRGVYDNPEEAWMDGWVAGWFAGHFKRTPGEPFTEPITEPINVL